jgi:hypothetical protein
MPLPTAPTPAPTPTPTPTPQPTTVTISGTLTATNGGQPIGATMDFGVATATAANGAHSVTVPAGTATMTLSISGTGLIVRQTQVRAGARTVNLDAISTQGFDQTFYRELVRNALSRPAELEPLRRWTRAPSIYLRTVDDSGREIAAADGRLLDNAERVIRERVGVRVPVAGHPFNLAPVRAR